jgi:hypothetical protein
MITADIITNVIAGLALLISLITAYKTLLSRFSGRIRPASRFSLSHVNNLPSIALACSLENAGARPGVLDDLRLVVKHNESGDTSRFNAQLARKDYGDSGGGGDKGWFLFSAISLPSREQTDRYVQFAPQNERFTAQEGHYEITVESMWYGSRRWEGASSLHFELSKKNAEDWNTPTSQDILILSAELMRRRNLFG